MGNRDESPGNGTQVSSTTMLARAAGASARTPTPAALAASAYAASCLAILSGKTEASTAFFLLTYSLLQRELDFSRHLYAPGSSSQ